MFKPMAWTVVFALAGSLLLTLTLTPVLASLFLKKTGHEHEPRFVGKLRVLYLRGLDMCLSRRVPVVVAAISGAAIASRRGRHLDQRDPTPFGRDFGGCGEYDVQ